MLSTARLSSALSPLFGVRLLAAGVAWLARVGSPARARARAASRPFALAPGLCLPHGQVRSLRLAAGDVVVVHQGRLWLTRPDDSRDHFLQPGTSFVAIRREVVVLEGLSQQACGYQVERAGQGQRG